MKFASALLAVKSTTVSIIRANAISVSLCAQRVRYHCRPFHHANSGYNRVLKFLSYLRPRKSKAIVLVCQLPDADTIYEITEVYEKNSIFIVYSWHSLDFPLW